MFIYQNYLKSQFTSLEFVREIYEGRNQEQIAHVLAECYLYKNPVHIPTGITYDELKEDFMHFLSAKKWKWTFVYYEKNAYLKGEYIVMGVISYTDVYDIYPNAEELAIKDFDQVPTPEKIRLYLKARATRAFFDKYSPKKGEACVIGTFAIQLKYMGSRVLSYQILLDSLIYIDSQGYTFGMGWAANKFAQGVYEKIYLAETICQDLSNIQVISKNQFPYRKDKYVQNVYIGYVKPSIKKISDLIETKLKQQNQ